jgi:8-oxo-dGTP diphosphatase
MIAEEAIRLVDPDRVDLKSFTRLCADSVVLTKDNRILFQRRASRGSMLQCPFGGGIEIGETPLQGVMRELNEELGAKMEPSSVIALGALTEAFMQHTQLVFTYFWHDRDGTITGCYEHSPVYYENVADALAQTELMDYARWMLLECQKRGLIT